MLKQYSFIVLWLIFFLQFITLIVCTILYGLNKRMYKLYAYQITLQQRYQVSLFVIVASTVSTRTAPEITPMRTARRYKNAKSKHRSLQIRVDLFGFWSVCPKLKKLRILQIFENVKVLSFIFPPVLIFTIIAPFGAISNIILITYFQQSVPYSSLHIVSFSTFNQKP